MNKEMDKETIEWYDAEIKNVEAEEAEMKEYYTLKQGENQLKFTGDKPEKVVKFNQTRVEFKILVDGNEKPKKWELNVRNPIYKHIIRRLRDEKYEMTIIKSGDAEATRFELKA